MSEEPTTPISTTLPKSPVLPPQNRGKTQWQLIFGGILALIIVSVSVITFFNLASRKETLLTATTATAIPSLIVTQTATTTLAPTAQTQATAPTATIPTAQHGASPSPTTRPMPTTTRPTVAPTATPNVVPGGVLFDWSSSSISCGSATQIGHYPSLIISNGYGDILYGADILYYDSNGDKNPSYSPIVSPATGTIPALSRLTLTITDPRANSQALQPGSQTPKETVSYMPEGASNGPVYSITVRFSFTPPNSLTKLLYLEQLNCF